MENNAYIVPTEATIVLNAYKNVINPINSQNLSEYSETYSDPAGEEHRVEEYQPVDDQLYSEYGIEYQTIIEEDDDNNIMQYENGDDDDATYDLPT
eukprot:Pgem_evm1s16509